MRQTLIPQFFGRMKNEIRKRDGEMSQWLRACLALAEDLSSVSQSCKLSSALFWTLWAAVLTLCHTLERN